MDSRWGPQAYGSYYMPSTSSEDLLNLFPFDDTIFPLNDPASTLNNVPHPQASLQSPLTQGTQSTSDFSMVRQPSATTAGTASPASLSPALFESLSPEAVASADQSPLGEWLLNPATGEVVSSTADMMTERDGSKRARTNVDDDIAACWKSPLCPNKMEDGGRPDSCKGECANYLFAHPSELPDDKKVLSEMLARSEPRVTVDPPTRQLKRTETDFKPDSSGRTLSGPPPTEVLSIKAVEKVAQTPTPATTSLKSTSTSPPPATSKSKGRVPHNQVEKKYRENVNAQLEALRRVVPVSKQQLVGFDGLDIEDLASSARQPSKAVVLSSATAYIKQLEKDNAQLREEMAALKAQNSTLQSLVKCDDCSLMNYVRRWKIQAPMA